MQTSMENRIVKLQREFPEIVARILSGEFKTISAAEQAAGIKQTIIHTSENAGT